MTQRWIAAWAYHEEFGTICRDARLGGGGSSRRYPGGSSSGQAGWHVAIGFSNLSGLASRLGPGSGGVSGTAMPAYFCGNWFDDCPAIRAGEVRRLAILAHGCPGRFFINGGGGRRPDGTSYSCYSPDPARPPLTSQNARDPSGGFHPHLHQIGLATSQDATVFLMGCDVANGPEGWQLLRALSHVWPGRRVVGFTTSGYRHSGEMYRGSGDYCQEPGMRDTPIGGALHGMERMLDEMWDDFTQMPWASERSPHAVVARDGQIIHTGTGVIRSGSESSPQGSLIGPPRPRRHRPRASYGFQARA